MKQEEFAMSRENTFEYELNGQTVTTIDAIISGRMIRSQAGLSPASDHIIIELGDRTSRSLGLEEQINLSEEQARSFRSFRGDRVYSLTINERGFEWGADEISTSDLRKYGNIPDDHELILDSKRDRPIEDDDLVRLKAKGVERILSRPMEKICIIVNTVEEFVDPGRLTFEDLAELAFPGVQVTPNTEYTVSYRKGVGSMPEGSLIAGESVKLKKGMIFDVSETDKS
ncbi:MAG: multiubiquitin domain-containing protein [Henriciella sp.]|nr:multiubiquitin domain-containing protein [Henriciella sp.]